MQRIRKGKKKTIRKLQDTVEEIKQSKFHKSTNRIRTSGGRTGTANSMLNKASQSQYSEYSPNERFKIKSGKDSIKNDPSIYILSPDYGRLNRPATGTLSGTHRIVDNP